MREIGFWRDARPSGNGRSSSDRTLFLQQPREYVQAVLLKSKSMGPRQPAAPSPKEDDDMERPDPTALVDHGWFMTHSSLVSMLEWYLVDGAFVESHELAYSYCRFRKCSPSTQDPKIMGACTMTDGVYCWPEGYWHYIRYHHVRPPQDFLDHVTANYRRAILAAKALNREHDNQVLWLWNAELRQPVPMPSATQEWILEHTTLQLLGAQKKNPPMESRGWDCGLRAPSYCGCVIS
ncbi:hypothetical protein Poli38472_007750 [Pythium oligandrum]|uniref:Uncharacterized protein n=1 Tax=Pythium oligandrum TaxID=41045 RepID=A0A8K1CTN0_PYTOL|nr:hypothetical protein Poli38472_007750 [Pythium oligandrum]|eukprot:TMW68078.1 hypothetical protein Poli38472_007750 [Pythium oligandrum]